MTSLKQTIEDIVDEFNERSDIDDKYVYLFQLGADLPKMDESLKSEKNRVKGCQSTLWFHMTRQGERFFLQADSDSMVVRGIAALLVRIIAGQTAEEIRGLDLKFLDRLNIWKLSSERNNGLTSMLQTIKDHVANYEK